MYTKAIADRDIHKVALETNEFVMTLKEGQLVNITTSPVMTRKIIFTSSNGEKVIDYEYTYTTMIYYNKEEEPRNLPVSKTDYAA